MNVSYAYISFDSRNFIERTFTTVLLRPISRQNLMRPYLYNMR